MAMRILIVECEPSLCRLYSDTFRRDMPEARVDIVVSFGGYLKVSGTEYDAYIMGETIDAQKSAFEHIAPKILERFPGAKPEIGIPIWRRI